MSTSMHLDRNKRIYILINAQLSINSYIYFTFMYLFILYSFMYWLIDLCIHSFIYIFIYLFIHSFIHCSQYDNERRPVGVETDVQTLQSIQSHRFNLANAWDTLAAKRPGAPQYTTNGAMLFTLDAHFSTPVTKPFTFSEIFFSTCKADMYINMA